MGIRTRACYLCGETYEYCNACSSYSTKPSWMSEFHSENCKNIFDICTRFNMHTMSKSEAQNALTECDLSKRSNFKNYIQRDLDNIFYEEPIVANVKAEIIEVTDEEIIVEVTPIHDIVKESTHVVVEKENE